MAVESGAWKEAGDCYERFQSNSSNQERSIVVRGLTMIQISCDSLDLWIYKITGLRSVFN